jgi:hypothetical protein
MSLRISTNEKEGVYQGSRWLKFQVLASTQELKTLFARLRPFFIFPLTGIFDGKPLSQETFLTTYDSWIEGLKNGKVPEEASLRKILAAAFTEELDALWLQEIAGKGFLTKIAKPIVLVQAHSFTYSKMDGEFRPMSMGQGSIFWGLQFSFPGVYQDAKTMELGIVGKERLFEEIRLWVREMTRATPFVVEGKRTNSPIRLGKECFSWIHLHPQLKDISIHEVV